MHISIYVYMSLIPKSYLPDHKNRRYKLYYHKSIPSQTYMLKHICISIYVTPADMAGKNQNGESTVAHAVSLRISA